MFHGNYLRLEESNKQQIEEVATKIQAENSETRATPKRVWIRPMHSTCAAFSWQEDKNEKTIIIKDGRVIRKRPAYFVHVIFELKTFYVLYLLSVATI